MDIIHGLSNLEIETTHTSSQEVEEKEEEVKRNWAELPPDVMYLIFLKLGTFDILCHAKWVCTSWCKLSKQPHLFRTIRLDVLPEFIFCCWSLLVREAIGRSCGLLVEFSVAHIASDELLHYLIAKSSSALKCVRLIHCCGITESALMEMVEKHPQLEKLEIICCSFETLGPLYSQYSTSLLLKHLSFYLSELRHLSLVGNQLVRDDGLRAILDGCTHLESLDLRQCHGLKFAGDLLERCGNIKVLRLPNDSIHDEYYSKYDSCEDYGFADFQMISDSNVYENDYDTD